MLDLARMQHRKQRRVDDEGLGISDRLADDLPPQGFQETPELPHPPVRRGRMEPHYPREQVREESLGVAQERALALHTTQLLEKRQRDDLRICRLLYGLVVPSARVEQGVGLAY
jgi:hypothetical protein